MDYLVGNGYRNTTDPDVTVESDGYHTPPSAVERALRGVVV